MTSVLDAAVEWATNSAACLPVRDDGSKAPAVRWQDYQHTLPALEDVIAWASTASGIGLVCGAVSDGLEMLELEGRAIADGMLTRLRELADDNGLRELLDKVCDGYSEATPSGGLHLLYRVHDSNGAPAARRNTKLARRIVEGQIQVLAETRGEGGFVVIAPSNGATHTTGKPWRLIAGAPNTLAHLDVEERDALWALVAMLDQMPAATPAEAAAPKPSDGSLRPGDDYNQRATWDEILTGWTKVRRIGAGYAWRRPGKAIGISATTGTAADGVDRLYAFTTSTMFESERPYSKFGAYALLEHHGDHTAAATALRTRGFGAPRETNPDLEALVAPPVSPPTATVTVGEGPRGYTATDDGNALRLVDRFGHLIRYVPERGSWLAWDGSRWAADAAETVREHSRTIARELPVDTAAARRHSARSLNAIGIAGAVRLAQSDPRVVARAGDLDARPYELNTPAGILDLRTATLRAPDPAALHTRTTGVAPDFDAPAPRFHAFLADTFAGSPELIAYVQQLLGQSLIGIVLEQILPFCYGAGANGKSTLLGVAQRVAGLGDEGYAIQAPAELLLQTRNGDHPTELARLAGARLVVTSELEDGQRFAEARVKLLTGKDSIAARFMRENYFTFTPTHSLWMLGNHQPIVRAGGPAFWRRLRLIPFLHSVPPEKRIADLEDSLFEIEGPAILAWIANGAKAYLTNGISTPAGVIAATDAYESDQDTIARFVAEECELGPANALGMSIKSAALRSAYEHWCHAEGETPVSAKALTTALRARFSVETGRDTTSRYYSGIRLRTVPEADDTSPWDLSSSAEPSPGDDQGWFR